MGTTENTAALYLRKSSMDERAGDNRSITDQRHDLERLAERHGLLIVKEYEERVGTSASHIKNHDRPQYDRALAEMGSTYKVLLGWATNRFVRAGMRGMGELLDVVDAADGRIITTDGVDTAQPGVRTLLAVQAEQDRAYITASTDAVRRGKEGQRRRGEYQGGSIPYGLLRDHDAEYGVSVDQEAADLLRRAAELLIGGATLRETCAALSADGHRTSQGSAWSATTIRRVLLSPHMVGHRYYKKQDVYAEDEDGNRLVVHEPILTETQFRRVNKAVAARAKVTNNLKRTQTTAKRHTSLLGGLLRCGTCGSSMFSTGKTETKGGRTYNYRTYRCGACKPLHQITAPDLDDMVVRRALCFLGAQEPESGIMEEVGRRWMARFTPEQAGRRGEIEEELAEVEGRHQGLQAEFYEKGTMDADVYERLNRKMSGRIEDLRDELRDAPAPKAHLGALLTLAASAEDDDPYVDPVGPGSSWSKLADHERREIIRVLVDQITVERRPKPGDDIEGRIDVEYATESNVVELANRPERILGKHISRAAKTA